MQKIGEIKEIFAKIPAEDICTIKAQMDLYASDERKGVQKILESQKKKIAAYEKEVERTNSLWKYERENSQYTYICGIDEVGRGPLAGPVVAAAVILPKDCSLLYINDSKQLSAAKREELYDKILEQAVSVGIGIVSHEVIDEINILQATYEAMRQAIKKLSVKPDLLLNDAVTIPGVDISQIPIIKGDATSISIGAASIVAKVYRDRMMVELDAKYPGYDFASNKGYGSPKHLNALKSIGPCEIHRRTFIKNLM